MICRDLQASEDFRLHHFFFFNDTATTEIYTLSLHDALPISIRSRSLGLEDCAPAINGFTAPLPAAAAAAAANMDRSEEHTSELQSRLHLVCRLLLEKKNGQCAFVRLYGSSLRKTLYDRSFDL